MMLHPQRPVYLNLLRIRLPIAGILSIIHRATGLAMVFALPALVWLLARSLADATGFDQVRGWLHSLPGQLLLLAVLWALLHHLFAGIRFLLIDIDVGVERPAYRYSAWVVIVAGPLVALAMLGVLR
jgi:succinate dehydrogenase / fumarate reductase cytochrome b subunit